MLCLCISVKMLATKIVSPDNCIGFENLQAILLFLFEDEHTLGRHNLLQFLALTTCTGISSAGVSEDAQKHMLTICNEVWGSKIISVTRFKSILFLTNPLHRMELISVYIPVISHSVIGLLLS